MQPVIVIAAITLFFGGAAFLTAQNHVSVPLGHSVYYLLEQAETRGLCPPLPAVKPYSRARIIEAINEILAAEPGSLGALTDNERAMLENARAEFNRGEAGFDPWKGKYRFDNEGKKGVNFSGDIGIALESLNSGAYYMEDKKTYLGTDTWGTLYARGDVGENFSFNVDISGGIMRAQRVELGTYDTYASQLDEAGDEFVNERLSTWSQPMAFFPYTYQKQWDGFMFGSGSISASGMKFWPQGFSAAPRLLAEISGTALGDTLLLRFGRHQREWGAMTTGSSLVYNAAARPFMGVEALFNPVPWFSFSSITGILEFYNGNGGIYDAPMTFQNAFSLYQAEFNYKNYFHLDFGSAAIWPKRFDMGYLFPLMDNFLYQNLTGKTDNVAIHMNVKGQYPGLGKLWFSVFVDEMEVSSLKEAFELDRHMFAYQAGLQGIIPGLPFSSLTLSYTKIEPYTYTHQRNFVPWYDRTSGPMEKAYVNNGVGIGHYLPPNSDEIKVRFDTRPWLQTAFHLQYQLIRHGADFGPHQVDGSSLVSELDPGGRSEKASLRKDFLHDGAYQWMHIIKIGASHTFNDLPLTVFGETGVAYSWFTDISNDEYAKHSPSPKTGGTPAVGNYIDSTALILTLGFRVFK